MTHSFLTFIGRFGEIPPQDAALLSSYAKKARLHSGDFFLHPGMVCRQVGFVLSGVFRVFVYNEEGKEIIRGFPAESNFMLDLESYHQQSNATEYWEAMTDVEYIYWEQTDIQRMEYELSCWYAILVPMMQHILYSASHERSEMFADDATKRYMKFSMRYPQIIARVPLRHIANYLGIAPQSLSRIRQQLAKSANK